MVPRIRAATSVALVCMVLGVPRLAHACAVCFSAREGSRTAFLVTTALLSLLPLGLIGGLIFWLRRKARGLAEAEAEARSSAELP